MPTKISNCSCAHEFQDQKYGKGMRVFNALISKPGQVRCTVCGSQKSVSSAPTETTKKKGKK